MRLFLSYIAARERASGKVLLLENAQSFSTQGADANGHVIQKAAEFLAGDAKGNELRSEFSDILIVIDNQITGSYEFPDPEDEARKKEHLEKQEKIKLLIQEIAALEKSAGAVSQIPVAHAAVLEEIALKREALEILQPSLKPVETPVKEELLSPGLQLALLSDEDLEKAAKAYEIDASDYLFTETSRERDEREGDLNRLKLIDAILEKAGYKNE